MRRRLAALVLALAVVCGLGTSAEPAHAATSSAMVVVQFASGHVEQVSITWTGTIDGIEALTRAGFAVDTIGYGALGSFVCRIDGQGPTQCPGPTTNWFYFRASAGANGWSFSPAGASSTSVPDGGWEGWRFGTGQTPGVTPSSPSSTPPPAPPASAAPPPANGVSGSDPDAPDAGTARRGDATSPNRTTDPDGTVSDVEGEDDGSDTEPSVRGERAERGNDNGNEQASAAIGEGASGNDTGSPVGVIVAGLIVAVMVAAAIVLHRRRAATPG